MTHMLLPMAEISKAVLITGCSSGIGEATARRLAAGGWTVYASARRPESIEHLEDAGCRTLALDVTDEDSMRAAVQEVERAEGAVGVLVNNAGYSQGGAIEQVPLEAARRQFETNVFGPIALTQLVLPAMRAQRWGKIVNIGSMGGRLTFPGGGLYHATKYSMEAISDALRFEVKGFGVDVVLIEPGLIMTEFANTAVAKAGEVAAPSAAGRRGGRPAGGTAANEPYAEFDAKLAALTTGVYEGPMRHLGGGPDAVAKAIEKAISRRRAPTRVPVDPLGAPLDPAAQAHPGSRLGRGDAGAVSAAEVARSGATPERDHRMRPPHLEALRVVDPELAQQPTVAASPTYSAIVCLPMPRASPTSASTTSWSCGEDGRPRMKSPSIFRYSKGRCLRYWKEPKPAPKSSSATAQPSAWTPAQKSRARAMSEIAAVSVTSITSRAGSTRACARRRSISRSIPPSVIDSDEQLIAIRVSRSPCSPASSSIACASTMRSISRISP